MKRAKSTFGSCNQLNKSVKLGMSAEGGRTIKRPTHFPQCAQCYLASGEILNALSEGDMGDVTVNCHINNGFLGWGRSVSMSTIAPHLESGSSLLADEVHQLVPEAVISQMYYNRRDVTDECPGINSNND